jgi:hypothetical protein
VVPPIARGRRRWPAAIALAGVLSLLAGVAAVALTTGTAVKIKSLPSGFDNTGKLSTRGRVLAVGGPVSCTPGGSIRIYITVTQRKSGAIARGGWRGTCSGSRQQYLVRKARARGAAAFLPGQTEACAAAVGLNGRRPTDATQWCGAVLLRR